MKKLSQKNTIIKIGFYFGSLISILFILIAINFTPDYVSKNLSSDGVLEPFTVFRINFIRTTFFVLGTTGFLFAVLCLVKPNLHYVLQTKVAEIPLFIKLLFLIDLALCFIHLIVHQYAHSDFIIGLFNLAAEANIPTWYSSMKLFCIFVLAGFFAYRKFDKLDIYSWLLFLLPLLFLTLSIDESARIHEWLGRVTDGMLSDYPRQTTIFRTTGTWMFVIGIPFLASFLLLMNSVKKFFLGQKYAFTKILVGMTIFLTGALGVEILSNFIQNKFYLIIQHFFEELLEMVGLTIIFWGFYYLMDLRAYRFVPQVSDESFNLTESENYNEVEG